MIQVENLALKDGEKEILSPISFAVQKGEKVLLAGESGAGKSSILKALLGGFSHWRGSVTIAEQRLSVETIGTIRNSIAYIPQEPRLGSTSVNDFFKELFHYKNNRSIVLDEALRDKLLDTLFLPIEIVKQDCSSLSGGERQRIAIIAALLLGKKILLADEITSALDAKSREAAVELLLKSDATVLSVSHDATWQAHCTRTITVQKGGKA